MNGYYFLIIKYNMNLYVTLYVALLFVVLTPGVLLTLPKGGSKLVVAAVHGLVFAVVYHFTNKLVWQLSVKMDGFQDTMAMYDANEEEEE